MTVRVPIRRGTALRLGLEPPRGPLLGVITMPNVVLSPEEYRAFKNRFAAATKGNWQFVYPAEVADDRSRRRALPWSSRRKPPVDPSWLEVENT